MHAYYKPQSGHIYKLSCPSGSDRAQTTSLTASLKSSRSLSTEELAASVGVYSNVGNSYGRVVCNMVEGRIDG